MASSARQSKVKQGGTFVVEKSATGKTITEVQEGLPEDNDAFKAARGVMKSKEWAEFGPTNRAECMIKLADLMEG